MKKSMSLGCLSLELLLLLICFSTANASHIITKPISNASVRNYSGLNIKMDGFWDWLRGDKKTTATPTPKPTIAPTSTPVPTPCFLTQTITITEGNKKLLGFRNVLQGNDIKFTVTSNGIIKVVKKKTSNNLEITALSAGEANIFMKDKADNIIAICHVIVKNKPVSSWFSDHELMINKNQTIRLGYTKVGNIGNIKFTVSPTDIIKAVKKNDNSTLQISGLNAGEAEIMIKDISGNIIDSCHVVVRSEQSNLLFSNQALIVNTGQTITLNYHWDNLMGNVEFTVRPSGVVNVVKKNNSYTLKITGIKSGSADIMMKDNAGYVIDTCHVTVKYMPTSTPTPTKRPVPTKTPTPISYSYYGSTKEVWTCWDTTSFDQNAYNDNYCESNWGKSGYFSDSQAVALDPDYTPSKLGDYYYNSK